MLEQSQNSSTLAYNNSKLAQVVQFFFQADYCLDFEILR